MKLFTAIRRHLLILTLMAFLAVGALATVGGALASSGGSAKAGGNDQPSGVGVYGDGHKNDCDDDNDEAVNSPTDGPRLTGTDSVALVIIAVNAANADDSVLADDDVDSETWNVY